MQDKEFDELFRSKLDDFEIAPSAKVWQGINSELDGGKRKKLLVPFMSIAASIIVLVTAGLLFIPKKGKVNNTQHPVTSIIAKTKTPVVPVTPVKTTPVPVNTPTVAPAQQVAVNQVAQGHHAKIKPPVVPFKVQQQDIEQEPLPAAEQPELAALPAKQTTDNAVVPGNETQIAVKQPVIDNADFISKPAIAAAQLPAATKPDAVPVKKRHGIRSLGDLINVVVATVDKRKDKVIEFTNSDDDDESNITAVNLGVIKVKK